MSQARIVTHVNVFAPKRKKTDNAVETRSEDSNYTKMADRHRNREKGESGDRKPVQGNPKNKKY